MHTLSSYDPPQIRALRDAYRSALLDDVIPFWQRHGHDHECGGYLTGLNRDGSVIDTDKSIWFQGRGAWTFATLFQCVEQRPDWLASAHSGLEFLRQHGKDDSGKLYFSVTREGKPLRMRRYAYSESFAAIANASFAKALSMPSSSFANANDAKLAIDATTASHDAVVYFSNYLRIAFGEPLQPPKVNQSTRPTMGIGPLMIGIATAQELRANLGDVVVNDHTCTEFIDFAIGQIEQFFMKPEHEALMEVVGVNGELIDHFDGRQLNPGHAIECAWFILHESKLRGDQRLQKLGLTILDWMWKRGWDCEHGGIFYFRDLKDLPVQEYWHDMKFWWPHCEAIIATLLAWTLTGDEKYAKWHRDVHDWSFRYFPDTEYGEWYGYLHRDGSISSRLKGNMWKGPFHLPRMLLYCWKLLEEQERVPERGHVQP
jgi:N-acylglucosamine 2-epimerase